LQSPLAGAGFFAPVRKTGLEGVLTGSDVKRPVRDCPMHNCASVVMLILETSFDPTELPQVLKI
jgi:hypothetical protein